MPTLEVETEYGPATLRVDLVESVSGESHHCGVLITMQSGDTFTVAKKHSYKQVLQMLTQASCKKG